MPPGQGIDREVTPREVNLDRVAELDTMRPAKVGVVVIGAEGRDLEERIVLARGHGSEPVLVHGAREQLEDSVRARIGGEVPVGGLTPEQHVTERPADHVPGMSAGPQALECRHDGFRRVDVHGGRPADQFRPRNRYRRQASFRSSARNGVNREYRSLRGSNGVRTRRSRASSSVLLPFR